MLDHLMLSQIDGDRLLVCCEKCGLVSNLSIDALLGSYGDQALNTLIREMSQRCSSIEGNKMNSECGMYFRNFKQRNAA